METKQRNIEILERYLDGRSKSDIARDIGLSRERVGQIIQRLIGRRSVDRITPEQLDLMSVLLDVFSIDSVQVKKQTGRSVGAFFKVRARDPKYLRGTCAKDIFNGVVDIAVKKLKLLEDGIWESLA